MTFDWESDQSLILFNPRLPIEERQKVQSMIDSFESIIGHFWISTSGSSGIAKWAALSKKAFLVSAKAVNEHLQSTSKDVWLNPLPHFHVGGLSILARGFLSGASVINYPGKWEVLQYHEMLCNSRATLSALVPAQIYDIVASQLTAPRSLRGLIVGGGSLSEVLYSKAIALGWPLLPSYGLTECCSQVATATLESRFPLLRVLPHMSVLINQKGLICIKGESLLTGIAYQGREGLEFMNPVKEGWLETEDCGELVGEYLRVFGRNANFLKIGGESVDLLRLESLLEESKLALNSVLDMVLVPVPHERLGHVIHLATTCSQEDVRDVIAHFETRVMPYERVRSVHVLSSIPRSPLGKILRSELLEKCL